jgi:hypothetical protein
MLNVKFGIKTKTNLYQLCLLRPEPTWCLNSTAPRCDPAARRHSTARGSATEVVPGNTSDTSGSAFTNG